MRAHVPRDRRRLFAGPGAQQPPQVPRGPSRPGAVHQRARRRAELPTHRALQRGRGVAAAAACVASFRTSRSSFSDPSGFASGGPALGRPNGGPHDVPRRSAPLPTCGVRRPGPAPRPGRPSGPACTRPGPRSSDLALRPRRPRRPTSHAQHLHPCASRCRSGRRPVLAHPVRPRRWITAPPRHSRSGLRSGPRAHARRPHGGSHGARCSRERPPQRDPLHDPPIGSSDGGC